jgi:D-tyrosyl-tRNA(Tyr) deacylase
LQRVTRASVTVEGRITGEIAAGLLILICAMQGDTEAEADKLAAKIAKLRIFKDAAGKMNLSDRDSGGAALVVSQFTLATDLPMRRRLTWATGSTNISRPKSRRMAFRCKWASSAPIWMFRSTTTAR